MDPNWRGSFQNMMYNTNFQNQENPENQTNIPNYPYPPYFGYPNRPPPNVSNTQMPMYSYPGFYPPPPGYGMVDNYYNPGSSTPKVRSQFIPEDNISTDMSVNEELSDSPVPPFCTQEGSQKNVKVIKDREKWSVGEDKALAEAWVTISTDASVGKNQKGDAFWQRVTSYYNKYNKSGSERSLISIKGRFHRTQPEINEFNEIFNRISNQYRSGWSDDQKIEAAREEWKKLKGNKTFNLQHMWVITKECVKWNSALEDDGNLGQMSGSKRSSSNTEGEVGTRPMGTKASKARKKGKNRRSRVEEDSDDDDLAKFNLLQKEKLEMMKQMSMTVNENSMLEELAVINADTSGMNDEAKRLHQIMANQIRAKYNM